MLKSNVKRIAIIFIFLSVLLLIVTNNCTKSMFIDNNKANYWKIEIKSDTKDIKDTQMINFKVENNTNVVNDKIAPGLKAKATVEIDLIDTKVPVDVQAIIDDCNLNDSLKLNLKLDRKIYENGIISTFEQNKNQYITDNNRKKILELELEWIGDYNDRIDTNIGNTLEKIELPIEINVTQHI